MKMFRKILVPTDFSQGALHAARTGFDFASRFNSEVHLLHVIEDPIQLMPMFASIAPPKIEELEAFAEAQLENWILPEDSENVTVVRTFRHGRPWKEIAEYAKAEEIELIVIGSHGQRTLEDVLLGSVTEKVVRTAPCPVLTVHQPEHHKRSQILI